MSDAQREWSRADRREIALLAGLPLVCAAVLASGLSGREPSMWVLFFVCSAIGGYVSLFVGVIPLLLFFRKHGWASWYHFAVAGFMGVVAVWLIPVAMLTPFHSSDLPNPESEFAAAFALLTIPGCIAAIGAAYFWYVCVRPSKPAHDV